jgi:hypothetical protein
MTMPAVHTMGLLSGYSLARSHLRVKIFLNFRFVSSHRWLSRFNHYFTVIICATMARGVRGNLGLGFFTIGSVPNSRHRHRRNAFDKIGAPQSPYSPFVSKSIVNGVLLIFMLCREEHIRGSRVDLMY